MIPALKNIYNERRQSYSNQAQRPNYDIRDDFKLTKINFGIIRKHVRFVRVNPYSAGIDFSRQNLTSVDVRF